MQQMQGHWQSDEKVRGVEARAMQSGQVRVLFGLALELVFSHSNCGHTDAYLDLGLPPEVSSVAGSHDPGAQGSVPIASSSSNNRAVAPHPPLSPLHSLADLPPHTLDGSSEALGIDYSTVDLDLAAANLQESVWAGRTRSGYQPPTVEDAEEDDPVEAAEDGEAPGLSFEDREVWERLHAEEQEEAEYEAISVWDELAETFLREGMISGASLCVVHMVPVCLTGYTRG